jgi:hypothetical protein
MLPALNYAERDRLEERLSTEEEAAVADATRELLTDAVDLTGEHEAHVEAEGAVAPDAKPLSVLGYASNGIADEIALGMLERLVDDLPIAIEVVNARLQASEFVALVRERRVSVVCFSDLPPSPSSKTRYLVRRLRAALPDVGIVVGRWGPSMLTDDSTEPLRKAGADFVASTLVDTRNYLRGLITDSEPDRQVMTPASQLA